MAEQSRASASARRRKQKTVPNFKTLTGEVRRGLKVGTFFLIVAARRVARCLLYSSYTAKSHSGMQTRSSASPSDVSSTRLSQTKSDLGVIIPHFGWQSNQKQVRPLEGANKKRFQTLRPSLEKSGEVLKLELFFACDVMMRSSKTE